MGNSLVRLCGKFCKSGTDEPNSLDAHGDTTANAGTSILAQDLFEFDNTSKVPEGLSQYVVSSKKAQANWYKKLLDAWREAKPQPKTPDEASRLVVNTLKRHQKADVEGLLAYYGLPLPHTLPAESKVPALKPEGVKYELQTLPVDAKAVSDGDTITVYVDTADPRESISVPPAVHKAAIDRTKARAVGDYKKADALHKVIIDAGYRMIPGINDDGTLAKKYRVRLRGIDAPESSMPFGKEAKEQLLKLVEGKSLDIYVTGDAQLEMSTAMVSTYKNKCSRMVLYGTTQLTTTVRNYQNGKSRQEKRKEDYGHRQILRSHGNGERTSAMGLKKHLHNNNSWPCDI